jgi:RimJ/RimL family protein N-acetyltransferase
MKSYACLQTQRVEQSPYAVIPVQQAHIENIRQWRNAQMDVLRQVEPITPEQQQTYYANTVWPEMNSARPSNILMSFLLRDEPIGYGGLVHVAWDHLRAEVSFLLAPERSGDPDIYAREFSTFLSLMKIMAFKQLGLHRLFTETYDIRPLHISIIESAGFLREGVMHHHVRIDGHPVDSLIHGCLHSYEK